MNYTQKKHAKKPFPDNFAKFCRRTFAILPSFLVTHLPCFHSWKCWGFKSI